MLDRLIRASLRHRLLVLALAALLLLWGGAVIPRLPVDVFPDLNKPTVSVMTEAHGLAPEEVEALVTLQLETAINGAPGITRLRSVSGIGLSVIYVEFDWGTDIQRDRQVVAERLQLVAGRLPEGAVPVMAPVSSLMGEILLIGLQSDGTTSPMELRSLADFTLRPRLLTISGVSQVVPIGGEVKQVQVLVDPQRLRAAGLSLDQVEAAAADAQGNTSGGFLDIESREVLVRNVARTASIDEIAATAITARDDVPLRLRDVGRVVEGARVKRGDASVDASPAVILAVSKQPGVNTLDLTARIEHELDSMRRALPAGVRLVVLFRQASFIDAATTNVEHALRDGSILVALVLLLFLANFRTTAITLTAIPLSLVVTALVFRALGMSVNTMTLGGVAIAVGELVDDAIVDVENVLRRLQAELRLPSPRHALAVIFDASSEIRNSIVYATILVILVFVPLFALSGIEGRFFAPLGVAYIVSILASLLVSLTVTPVLCSLLLPKSKAVLRQRHGSRLAEWIRAQDRRLVAWCLPRAGRIVLGAGLAVAVAVAVVPFFGREFLPPFNEGTATITVIAAPGTSLEESNGIGQAAERMLLSVPEVVQVGRRTGRAELDEHAEGVQFSEIDVDFRRSERRHEAVLADIREKLAQIPGVFVNIGQPISHRLDHLLSGVRAQVSVKLFGPDLDVLRSKAEQMSRVMHGVRGAVDVNVEPQVLVPQVLLRVRREAAARFGMPPGAVARQLETALAGRVVAQVLDGQRIHDLVVRYDAPERATPDALASTLVTVPDGRQVPLAALVEIVEAEGPNQIGRENGQRRIVVSCNVAGRDLVGTVEDIERRITADVPLPSSDYFVQFGGQFESQRTAAHAMALLSLLSLAGMTLVLWSHFRSLPIVVQILVNIPLALIGAVAAVALSGGVFSIASLVGFVTLTGIASRNTIMMLSHYLHLVRHEGERVDEAMIVRGSSERVIPVLMTALTAGLSLVPLVMAPGMPGREILHPLATVILGGLVSSTLLDVVVTPAVFWRFGRRSFERLVLQPVEGTSP